MTKQEIEERIKLLEEEIVAHERANYWIRNEIEQLNRQLEELEK